MCYWLLSLILCLLFILIFYRYQLEELKVLPSDEGFSWANENYSSWQRSIDVWSFVLSLRVRVLLDNAKWAYVGGFTEEKQVGSG